MTKQNNLQHLNITGISAEALQQILENFTETNKQEPKSKVHNLKKISEKLVIEKFTGKNANVSYNGWKFLRVNAIG